MSNCQNPVAYRYTWPGKDEAYTCATHAHKLKSVANAIGLYVQLLPINENDENKQCEQKI